MNDGHTPIDFDYTLIQQLANTRFRFVGQRRTQHALHIQCIVFIRATISLIGNNLKIGIVEMAKHRVIQNARSFFCKNSSKLQLLSLRTNHSTFHTTTLTWFIQLKCATIIQNDVVVAVFFRGVTIGDAMQHCFDRILDVGQLEYILVQHLVE